MNDYIEAIKKTLNEITEIGRLEVLERRFEEMQQNAIINEVQYVAIMMLGAIRFKIKKLKEKL
jgi:hypothetical protein